MKTLMMLIGIALLISSCNKDKKQNANELQTLLSDNHFRAVDMPKLLITGHSFPTDSVLINDWVSQSKTQDNLETNADIINHGWALWQALTEPTDQANNYQTLKRFETWYTPDDIIEAYTLRKINPDIELQHVKRHSGTFESFNQFHGRTVADDPSDQSVVGFVKYDPSAANHIFDNNLFYATSLEAMMENDAIANIPDFPNGGVVLKPVFSPLDSISSVNGLYVVPIWPGDGGNPNRPFGSDQWNNYVYVTIDGMSEPEDHIYSVRDFVHFKLDSLQAKVVGGKAGDHAVLQGMHVTTRETKRWTWQTFWWSEYHNTPQSPSSSIIAGLRPVDKLSRAANHYAMAIGYNMIQPVQLYNGGSGENGTSIYAYNPYLEAGFDTDVFDSGNDSIQKYHDPDYQKVGGNLNQYGMQTNCMSCHGQARFIPGLYGREGHLYITDQYFQLDEPYFRNTVKLDFTWSIQGNLIDDNEQPLKPKTE